MSPRWITLAIALSWSITAGLAGVAGAVVIDSVDGAGNTAAPVPDPGWHSVGTLGGLTVVHLGDGWVLTANHVGAGDVWLDGVVYPLVPNSTVRLKNPDGTNADLIIFAIDPHPDTALVPIVSEPPPIGTEVFMIGRGRNRGGPTSWDPNGPPPPGPYLGYDWAPGATMRWGRNHIVDYPQTRVVGTWPFATSFDPNVSSDEAQAVTGDSGGATFVNVDSEWTLAGIMYAISTHPGQPAQASFYGQLTYSADLSVYADQIEAVRSVPEPQGGLPAGLLTVLVLKVRHARHERRDAARTTQRAGPA